jgi:hypothetical protein
MNTQNTTISELFAKTSMNPGQNQGQGQASDSGVDSSAIYSFAQTLFAELLVRRYPALGNINEVDDTVISTLASLAIGVSPSFLRAWGEVAHRFYGQAPRQEQRTARVG